MEFKIIWSEFAESQLDKIYRYYENNASSQIALKLIKGIINAPNNLLKESNIGQVEELLQERKIQYRYLVFKNYKLIYSVNKANGLIRVADVFDTRQNPTKIKRTK